MCEIVQTTAVPTFQVLHVMHKELSVTGPVSLSLFDHPHVTLSVGNWISSVPHTVSTLHVNVLLVLLILHCTAEFAVVWATFHKWRCA